MDDLRLYAHTSIACISLTFVLIVCLDVLTFMRRAKSNVKWWMFWVTIAIATIASFFVAKQIHPFVSIVLAGIAFLLWKMRKRLEYEVSSRSHQSTIRAAYQAKE